MNESNDDAYLCICEYYKEAKANQNNKQKPDTIGWISITTINTKQEALLIKKKHISHTHTHK